MFEMRNQTRRGGPVLPALRRTLPAAVNAAGLLRQRPCVGDPHHGSAAVSLRHRGNRPGRQASSYAAAGNFDAAEKAAKSSKRFSLIACLVFAGLIMLVILSQLLMFFVPFLLLLFAGAASNP